MQPAPTSLLDLPLDCVWEVQRRLDPRSLAATAATCRLLAACAADDTLWEAAGAATWPVTWAASRAAAPTARAAFAARASLPPALAAGVEDVQRLTQVAQTRETTESTADEGDAGPGLPSEAARAAARAATAAATAADAADFEAVARALFRAGLPAASDAGLKKTPEYGQLRRAVGWWLAARAATVVAFARAPAAELQDRGGVGAALIAWPSVPWRASALAVLRDAARGLTPPARYASVLARLDAEAGGLERALAAVALEDVAAGGGEEEREDEAPQPPSDSDDEGETSAPPDTPLPPSLAWAAVPPRRVPRPCAAVPAGVPREHWWWRGRTPAEAGV